MFKEVLSQLNFIFKKRGNRKTFFGFFATLIVITILASTNYEKIFVAQGVISTFVTILLAITSIIIKKPIVAFTSHLVRRWPMKWYEHKKVNPAYYEVTVFWIIYFILRLFFQINTIEIFSEESLIFVNLFLGWPLTIIMLVLSYLYGVWRLKNLGGPSVKEFLDHKKPPWESQKKGF